MLATTKVAAVKVLHSQTGHFPFQITCLLLCSLCAVSKASGKQASKQVDNVLSSSFKDHSRRVYRSERSHLKTNANNNSSYNKSTIIYILFPSLTYSLPYHRLQSDHQIDYIFPTNTIYHEIHPCYRWCHFGYRKR